MKFTSFILVSCLAIAPACRPTGTPNTPAEEGAATESAATSVDPTSLPGTRWNLTALNGSSVPDAAGVTLEFDESGRIGGFASCNRYFGSAEIDGNDIAFSQVGSTRRACEGDIMQRESAYLAALQAARRIELDDRFLSLYPDGASDPSLRFTAANVDVSFRAVGNEPGWILEFLPGQRITLEYDYGESRAETPFPEPETDDSGITTYHAVTEAHNLEVKIDPASCTDDMSGQPHEVTVVVKIDGRTFRGCGDYLD